MKKEIITIDVIAKGKEYPKLSFVKNITIQKIKEDIGSMIKVKSDCKSFVFSKGCYTEVFDYYRPINNDVIWFKQL